MRWLFLTFILTLFPSHAAADSSCECCVVSSAKLQLIGDSQCVGSSMVTGRVAETKRWASVKATCQGGTRTPYWNERVKELSFSKGDAVVIYLGSNDWGRPDPKPILTKIAPSGATCVWVGPPLIRGNDNGVASHLKKVIEEDGTCAFLDSRTLNLQQGDGVHPGPQEHARWLRAALSKLP